MINLFARLKQHWLYLLQPTNIKSSELIFSAGGWRYGKYLLIMRGVTFRFLKLFLLHKLYMLV